MSKPWFKTKKFGYGLTPISWEGWACAFILAFIVIAVAATLS